LYYKSGFLPQLFSLILIQTPSNTFLLQCNALKLGSAMYAIKGGHQKPSAQTWHNIALACTPEQYVHHPTQTIIYSIMCQEWYQATMVTLT